MYPSHFTTCSHFPPCTTNHKVRYRYVWPGCFGCMIQGQHKHVYAGCCSTLEALIRERGRRQARRNLECTK
jgi:hypothetical protein